MWIYWKLIFIFVVKKFNDQTNHFCSATKFLSKDEISIESPMPELRNISRISNNEETNTDTKKKVNRYFMDLINERCKPRTMKIISNVFQRPSEKAYFIAKELLSTERTYRKDLEVISFVCVDFLTILLSFVPECFQIVRFF